ncbi:MAG: 4Fe-4S dicluster domain-containing protein [bacterium]
MRRKEIMQKILSKNDLYKKIKELSGKLELIGPREFPNKGIFYQVLQETDDLYLGEGFTIEPVKKFFLEPSTCILKSNYEDGFNIDTTKQPDKERIIIGARPCETRGLTLLDKVFDGDSKDNFYINNRKRTTIVGLACAKPDRACFCTSMGGSPADSAGMDALIVQAGDNFVIDIITDKGKKIFSSAGEDLSKEKAKEIAKEKKKDIVKTKIKVPESLDTIFTNDYWGNISKACISCGVCTYVCPTCHCFDLVDEERSRLRCYDGCAFADFTLEASGENPRPTKKERYRQRVFHKFDYFKKNFGENLCVGCGRCIRHCPVKIDIADVVDKAPV